MATFHTFVNNVIEQRAKVPINIILIKKKLYFILINELH